MIALIFSLSLMQTPQPLNLTLPQAAVQPVPITTQTQSPWPWMGLAAAGPALDVATTCYALTKPGVREGNPRMAKYSCGQMAAIKGGMTGLQVVYLYFLNKNHPTATRRLSAFIFAVGAYVSARNLGHAVTAK
jgi:hypothetical protein